MQRLYNKSFSENGWTSFDSTAQSDLVFYGLGNTRVTFKDATSCSTSDHQFEVVSMHDYYPFGKVLRAFTQESERYLTTQHPRDAETDWDYRGARFYDSDIGRFLGVDPLALQYPEISSYAYVANNPIIFIDPDGREIKDGRDVFDKFRKGVNNRVIVFSSRAELLKNKSMMASISGRNNKAARLSKRADTAKASANAYEEVLVELNKLEASDQVYNIYTSVSDVSSGSAGNVRYHAATDAVNVSIKDSYNAGALAHELKHAYQFEIGAISFDSSGRRGGSLYDLQDEVEAYARGTMFGYPLSPTLKDLQRDYETISLRSEQLTLNSPSASFDGAPTLGVQLANLTSRAFKNGKPTPEYYRDWKSNYK